MKRDGIIMTVLAILLGLHTMAVGILTIWPELVTYKPLGAGSGILTVLAGIIIVLLGVVKLFGKEDSPTNTPP
jgi:uncharacterized membrane protein HdeD (DUF308 family)